MQSHLQGTPDHPGNRIRTSFVTFNIRTEKKEKKEIEKKNDRIATLEHSVPYKFETIVLFLLPMLACFFFFPLIQKRWDSAYLN